MRRREALKNVAAMLGTAAISSATLTAIESCSVATSHKDQSLFTEEQLSIITEVSDTIIPTTTTPGAKAAAVGAFIAMMMQDCYPADIQKIFIEGLEDVEKRSRSSFQNSFVDITAAQRIELLTAIVRDTEEQKRKDQEKTKDQESGDKKTYFFPLIKELTLLGYFTSEIGATQALSYVAVPGRHDACIPLDGEQRSNL